jgi:hypothetical protein
MSLTMKHLIWNSRAAVQPMEIYNEEDSTVVPQALATDHEHYGSSLRTAISASPKRYHILKRALMAYRPRSLILAGTDLPLILLFYRLITDVYSGVFCCTIVRPLQAGTLCTTTVCWEKSWGNSAYRCLPLAALAMVVASEVATGI